MDLSVPTYGVVGDGADASCVTGYGTPIHGYGLYLCVGGLESRRVCNQ